MELIRELKRNGIDVPTLLMSGHAAREIQDAAVDGLIRGVVSKPFGITDLRKAVQEVLDRRE